METQLVSEGYSERSSGEAVAMMLPAIPVSVVIMTKNEEKVLDQTLDSVRGFAEVFVVDSLSTDRTREIANRDGVRLVDFAWDRKYPKKKEWCLSNLDLSHEWVLYLDADERVPPALAEEIRGLFVEAGPSHEAYEIDLEYHFLGRRLRHGHRVKKRILLKASATTWPRINDLDVSTMWEVEGHYQPEVEGTVGTLAARLGHDDLDSLYGYFARHNRYSDWEAYLRTHPVSSVEVGKNRSARAQRYARVPFRPFLFFFYSYVFRLGFLDGRPGLHYAVAHAFYFWQISVKVLELESDCTKDSSGVRGG